VVVDSRKLVAVTVNDGDSFVGLKGVGTVVVHRLREAPHDVLCLTVEVPHHGIAMPATHEQNVYHVDLSE
jgi:hypothetical protein